MMFAFRSRDVTVCERAPYTYVGYRTKCHLLIIEQYFVSVTVKRRYSALRAARAPVSRRLRRAGHSPVEPSDEHIRLA